MTTQARLDPLETRTPGRFPIDNRYLAPVLVTVVLVVGQVTTGFLESWWRTFLEDTYGEIFVARRKRGIKVRAAQVKSERLKEAVSAAYREKYNTRGSIGYVEDMSRSPSRDTTTELLPR